MVKAPPDDSVTRRLALDPGRSFIVQAPAGSGKTELLTRRFLTLLAEVEEPEEIVAITFTRKAAGEMQSRILSALELAADDTPPTEPYRFDTWQLARSARKRDATRSWQLLRHPARLRVQTIDALNAELTWRMPLLSKFGSQPDITEQPQPLYEQAARQTLALLEDGGAAAEAVMQLLRHLDNHVPRTINLIAELLPRRDQWLRHTGAGGASARLRTLLEAAIGEEIRGTLRPLSAALPPGVGPELAALAGDAAKVLQAQAEHSAIIHCARMHDLPGIEPGDVPAWQGIAELLLTQQNTWRKQVNVRQGFPPEASAAKARVHRILGALAACESLRARLAWVRLLPEPRYPEAQWQALDALITVLPMAAAQLQLIFSEHAEVDYPEVAMRALAALGAAARPTDLGLTLDHRIRHLLVDEFQDTSMNQFALLERLTAGWEQADGRTLFLVGDPMQSIYRFREAEVGLFLRAQESGLGQIALQPLTLTANFRSQAGLVDWFNDTFHEVLPQTADIASGAVPYSRTEARRPALSGRAVTLHPVLEPAARLATVPGWEAAQVCEVVRATRQQSPEASIAVLARNRSQLVGSVRALRDAGLRFRAVELESLSERPVVQDILALVRALLHPADRTAWLAVLRAPWCGLTLAALHGLASGDANLTVPELLRDEAKIEALQSQVAGTRFMRVREILLAAVAERRRGSLRNEVEGLWLRLGAPATLESMTDLADAEACFDLLGAIEEGAELADPRVLEAALQRLFAHPDSGADDSLQIMTLHRAKGLEFDTVIMPGLGWKSGRDSRSLLVWLERPRAGGSADLLLAPLHASGGENDPLYEFVSRLKQEQEQLETARLLYVGCTRARAHLHLIGHTMVREQDGQKSVVLPRAHSLLSLLWPVVSRDYEQAVLCRGSSAGVGAIASDNALPLRRLRADWEAPPPPAAVLWEGAEEMVATGTVPHLGFEWAGDTLRHIGTVVHRLLQRVALTGVDSWSVERVGAIRPTASRWLVQLGVPEMDTAVAVDEVCQALVNALGSDSGRWILDSNHDDARCEYALSAFAGRELVTGVIDRCFVDNEGVRWIIDYKTGRHQGADINSFLDQEAARYRPQLERYAALMRGREHRPIRAGLYFPLLDVFRVVELE